MDIEAMPKRSAEYVVLFDRTSNIIAKKFYASFGFTDIGIIQDKSVLAIKNLEER